MPLGSVQLVSGEGEEVDLFADDVDRHVGDVLSAVDEDLRTDRFGPAGDLGNRRDGAEDVGHTGDGDDLRFLAQDLVEAIQVELAVVGEGDEAEDRAGGLCDPLPGDEVGVVLHLVDEDLITGLEELAAPAVGDDVDRHRGAGGESDLLDVFGPDELPDLLAGVFDLAADAVAKAVHAAVRVGVVLLVDFPFLVDDALRLLGGGGRVEVDDGETGGKRLLQCGELGPDGLDVEQLLLRGGFVVGDLKRRIRCGLAADFRLGHGGAAVRFQAGTSDAPQPLDHGVQAVAALGDEVVFETEFGEDVAELGLEDFPGRLAVGEREQDDDQAVDDAGVTLGAEVNAGGAVVADDLRDEPDLRLAAVNPVGFVFLAGGEIGKLFAEFDEVAALVLPLPEEIELFDQLVNGDRLELRHNDSPVDLRRHWCAAT